jgi:hypothetical protein
MAYGFVCVVESLQSHFILTMSHWSSGLPVCFPSQATPGGCLCETGILLLALSRYIGDPDVIDNFCGLVLGGVRSEPSLGPRADQWWANYFLKVTALLYFRYF